MGEPQLEHHLRKCKLSLTRISVQNKCQGLQLTYRACSGAQLAQALCRTCQAQHNVQCTLSQGRPCV